MEAAYVAAIFGLLGALIGSASSIVAMIIQVRVRDKRDRSKQLTDLALAEFKAAVDFVTSGKAVANVVPPLGLFLYKNDLQLRALESGTFTPETEREIAAKCDQMADGIDKRRRAARSGLPQTPDGSPTNS
jgi:hypothetical protein